LGTRPSAPAGGPHPYPPRTEPPPPPPPAPPGVSSDTAAAFILWPEAQDRTRIECRFLFHKDEMAREDFDPADAVDFWDLVNRQDWAVCERVQRGISARVHDHGWYLGIEDYSLDIRRYIAAKLGESGS